jgi:hypothetical protein
VKGFGHATGRFVRPSVDEYVFGLLAERTFFRREFVELPTGQVRIAPSLARHLAEY